MIGMSKESQLKETSIKTKNCKRCNGNLPLDSFTSTKARYCKQCHRLDALDKQHKRTLKQLERTKSSKQKKKTVIKISDLKKKVQRVFNKWIIKVIQYKYMKICSVKGCKNKVKIHIKGWCRNHYMRWYNHGSPTGGTHYKRHGMVGSKIYNVWKNIKSRVYNKKDQYYYCYGGRGISMYPLWEESFTVFHKYIKENIGDKPSKNYSIDRINNDGDYEPGNIRWATPLEQSLNKTSGRNTSGYKGVSWKNKNKKWQSAIRVNGKSVYLGLFDNKEAAAKAYDSHAKKIYGESARPNFT